MDLNHLIFREGEERLRAGAAGCDASRAAHRALADLYRDCIDVRRRALHSTDLALPRLRVSARTKSFLPKSSRRPNRLGRPPEPC